MSFAADLIEPRADTSTVDTTKAFSLPPSEVWDGNDGAWSTFVIRVGNPPQYFRVLPSTLGTETWIPIPDKCDNGISWCGNARGVEPFNAGTSGPSSGAPDGSSLGMLDAGNTCTANKSPMCIHCTSVNGRCTNGPCAGRTCCGDPPGACGSGGCNGISGICTGQYIGCPCPGPDWNAGDMPAPGSAVGSLSPILAQGFGANASTTWKSKGLQDISLEKFLNYTATGQYGLDSVGVGALASSGLTVDSSVVVGIPTLPFYLGKLGLLPSNKTGTDSKSQSFMSMLASQKRIPSLSYGYTAGALYKQSSPLGSLTFGGYDAARFTPNDITFYIDNTQRLLLPIQSIVANKTLAGKTTLLNSNITATIDTTTPSSWLPVNACKAFEKAFGLTWDTNSSFYLVSDSAHQQLLNQNPQITFTLGGEGSNTVNITLPYAAFDLQASQPFFPNGTNVFPIRRATSPNQYTIGRAFFQEAYLVADYETRNFSISQATYPIPASPNIVTIDHNANNAKTTDPAADQNPQKLTTGAITGISIGSSVGVILLIILAWFLWRRRRKQLAAAAESEAAAAAKKGSDSSDSEHEPRTNSQPPSFRSSNNHSRPMDEKAAWDAAMRSDTQSPYSHGSGRSGTPPNELVGSLTPWEMSGYPEKGDGVNYFHHPYYRNGDRRRSSSGTGRSGTMSREESLRKPLPRTPVELAGDDVAQLGSHDTNPVKPRALRLEGVNEREASVESPIDRHYPRNTNGKPWNQHHPTPRSPKHQNALTSLNNAILEDEKPRSLDPDSTDHNKSSSFELRRSELPKIDTSAPATKHHSTAKPSRLRNTTASRNSNAPSSGGTGAESPSADRLPRYTPFADPSSLTTDAATDPTTQPNAPPSQTHNQAYRHAEARTHSPPHVGDQPIHTAHAGGGHPGHPPPASATLPPRTDSQRSRPVNHIPSRESLVRGLERGLSVHTPTPAPTISTATPTISERGTANHTPVNAGDALAAAASTLPMPMHAHGGRMSPCIEDGESRASRGDREGSGSGTLGSFVSPASTGGSPDRGWAVSPQQHHHQREPPQHHHHREQRDHQPASAGAREHISHQHRRSSSVRSGGSGQSGRSRRGSVGGVGAGGDLRKQEWTRGGGARAREEEMKKRVRHIYEMMA